jgi:hypothetical protein
MKAVESYRQREVRLWLKLLSFKLGFVPQPDEFHLAFEVEDEGVEPLLGERIGRQGCEPSRLLEPSLQFHKIVLLSHASTSF